VTDASEALPAARQPGRERHLAQVAGKIAGLWLIAGPMLSMIDSSVVNVAIPAMARDLHEPLDTVQWVLSGYLLALAIGLPSAAWLGRRFGLRKGYVASLGLFVLASAACALAPNIDVLITARILQGLLGAPMVPLAIGLLVGGKTNRNIPASVGILFFAAPALGPAIGGVLVASVGWRSIFLVNVPLGLAALAGAWFSGPADPGDRGDRAARPDLPGLLALGAGLGLVAYGCNEAPQDGWLGRATLPWWLGGLVLLACYALWERWLKQRQRTPPAVDLHMLRTGPRLAALALVSDASVILYAVLFFAPVYLQYLQGYSAAVAGLALLPQGAVMALTTRFGNRVIRLAGLRASVAIGMALLTVSSVGLLYLGAATPVWTTALILSGRGVALGLVTQPLTQSLLGGLDPAQIPDANTLFSMSQRLAGSLGVALLASIFTSRARATHSPILALHECALVMAAVAAVGTLAALVLRRISPSTAAGAGAE